MNCFFLKNNVLRKKQFIEKFKKILFDTYDTYDVLRSHFTKFYNFYKKKKKPWILKCKITEKFEFQIFIPLKNEYL